MLNILINNKKWLIVMSFFILVFNLMGCSKRINTDSETDILLNTNKFITCLFENKLEDAGELSLGIVRFNVLSNKADIKLEEGFDIEDIELELDFVSDNLAVVNSVVSYMDNGNDEYDTVFYRIQLVRDKNAWKIYCLNETDPPLNNKEIVNSDTLDKENFEEIFGGYIDNLSGSKYQEASKYLIGRAKKMHKKANPALNELDLVNTITGLKTEIICAEKDNVVVRFDYKNNDRPMSVLVYFYLTSQGWRIYNVSQI